MNKINHKMLQLARESRSFTQTEVASLLNIPQGNLSRMERGEINIKEEYLNKISNILNYPLDFFYQFKQIYPSDTHYRKSVTIDQRTKLKAEALMNIYKFNIDEMLISIDLDKNIPILTEQYDSPQKIAKYLRSFWKIPKGPIENLCKLAESNGIIVIYVDFETDKIEGRTIISDIGNPIVFININSSGDRQRLTLAHEIAHVILHLNTMPTFTRDEELEAFTFAHEFLMPLSECQYDLNDQLSLAKLSDLKRTWKLSMQSILNRAQKENLTNKNRCRYLWSLITSKGWKKREPIDIPKETPTTLDKMIEAFIKDLNYTKTDLSKMFKLNFEEFEKRYFSQVNKLRIT